MLAGSRRGGREGGGGVCNTMPCWEGTCRVLPSCSHTKWVAVVCLTAPSWKGLKKESLEKSTYHTKSCTFPLTLWMGSTTTATALSESASKLWYKKIQNLRQNYKVTYNKFTFIHFVNLKKCYKEATNEDESRTGNRWWWSLSSSFICLSVKH